MTAKRARLVKARKAGHKIRQSQRVILRGDFAEDLSQRLMRQYAEANSVAFLGRVTSVRSDGVVLFEPTTLGANSVDLAPEKKPGGGVP